MKKIYVFIVLVFGIKTAQAQQDLQLTNYVFNQVYWNPAAVAIEPDWIYFNALYRVQWLGYNSDYDAVNGNPTSQLFSVGLPYKFKKNSIAIGINLANEQLGPLTNFQIGLNLAYMINLDLGVFSIGGRINRYSQTINTSILRFVNPNDPFNVGSGDLKASQLDFAFGFYFDSETVFAGISVNHATEGSFSNLELPDYNPLALHYYILTGYNFLTTHFTFTPSVLIKLVRPNILSFESTLLADFNKFYVGLSLRDVNAVGLLAGLRFLNENLRLGYSFDYHFSNSVALPTAASSHELNISYRLPSFSRKTKYIVRNPRFRKE